MTDNFTIPVNSDFGSLKLTETLEYLESIKFPFESFFDKKFQ